MQHSPSEIKISETELDTLSKQIVIDTPDKGYEYLFAITFDFHSEAVSTLVLLSKLHTSRIKVQVNPTYGSNDVKKLTHTDTANEIKTWII